MTSYRKDKALWVSFEVHPFLLQVNASPGLEGIEEATDKDSASESIIAIEKKLQWLFTLAQ